MSPPLQHLFSTNAVLNVWRNLRHARGDPNDLLLTLHVNDEGRTRRFGKGSQASGNTNGSGNGIASGDEIDGGAVGGGQGTGGKSIGFVVPWRSMQAQNRELKEREKKLADALVVLAGEVAFTGMFQSQLLSISHRDGAREVEGALW